MLTRKQTILVKQETTYGTDSTPDNSNRIYVTEIDVASYEGDRQTRERMQQHLGARAEVNAGPYVTLAITVPLAGAGAAGTTPVFGALLRACAMSETINADTDVVYQPVSDAFESCTVYYLQDGQQQKATGCRGTWSLNAKRGQFPTLQFNLTGLYNKPEAASPVTISALTQANEVPVNKQNTGIFSVHGFSAVGESLSLDIGNEVVHRNLIGAEKVNITDRQSAGQLNIEAPNIGTKDYFAAVESHQGETLGALAFEHGTTPGNIVAIAAPKVQLSTISPQDSDGIVHYQMGARFLPDTGDDEFTLTFK